MMIGDRILISHFFERERFSVSNTYVKYVHSRYK